MEDFDAKLHVDHLVEIANGIELGKVTILTGSNASGKSVIRKCLSPRIAKKLSLDETKNVISELSFMTRAGNNINSGVNFLRDSTWTSTGQNTAELLMSILNTENRYIVLDEPELGMGEELQLTIANYINEHKDKVLEKNYGLMVITHSRVIANALNEDVFINIDNPSWAKTDWLNRKINQIDFKSFQEKSDKIFEEIRDRTNKKSR